ncbi:putative PDDEXK endonuclease [Pseudomonas aeruginosa]|uniref:putative PDDEXK endonuclease n=1 Tax=Pseudomonas aeruginosa TaxID=287 RepID=UPI001A2CC071|nr:hypothetical protein [Pseudomonas aeruginosa]MBI7277204.1 hypothetical protein [Pseudomonas aeruginosa]MBX5886666.1 hypothetical protein [Pseudomonas aeruginosa]MCD2752706.1 hypothetical protein [Pseudomonas aeruginosa]MDY1084429.1 hypothetical protein [Pseudomonas aeruginosa]HBO9747871.1 hypothetical protein [Pseudomonas aeruginosa]
MTNSRAKGARVELDFAKLCFEHLGIKVERNLEQSRSGGHDLSGLDGWALEIKARANVPGRKELLGMWTQTLDQAQRAKLKPALAVKVDRRGWTVYVDLADLSDAWVPCKSWAAIEPEDFFQLVREGM